MAAELSEKKPWDNAPLVKEGSDPWKHFGAEPGELDHIVSFNPRDGAMLTNDNKALVEAIQAGGRLVYYQRPGDEFFAAILYPKSEETEIRNSFERE